MKPPPLNLTELLRHPEGKSLEFKRDLSSSAGVLRTIIAFANTAGGTLHWCGRHHAPRARRGRSAGR